jgi:CotH kinase protein
VKVVSAHNNANRISRLGSAKHKPVIRIIITLITALAVLLFSQAHFNLLKYKFLVSGPNEPFSFKLLVTAASALDALWIVKNSFLVMFNDGSIPSDSQLKTIHLKVETGSIQKMASNLPVSAKKQYYDAKLLYPDGSWQDIKYRFRGRSIFHWNPEKPSLRLKLRKSIPLYGLRHINLINPEDRPMISNYFGEQLGQSIGVLTHKTELTRLFINNEFFGVYHMTTREDEEMLRINNRIPGPIFSGDALSPKWIASQFNVYGDTKILERLNPMENLVNTMYMESSITKYERLWKIISMEKLARWHALMVLVSSVHTDYMHNHLYYFDPSTGLLEPIVSDINGHILQMFPSPRERLTMPYEPYSELPINERIQPLLDIALRDPRFLHRRNEILYNALNGIGSFVNQKNELDNIFSILDGDVYADRKKSSVKETFVGYFRIPYSNSQYESSKNILYKWIHDRNIFLHSELNNVFINIKIEKSNKSKNFVISIDGNVAVIFNSNSISGEIYRNSNIHKTAVVKKESMLLYPGLKENNDLGFRSRNMPEHTLTHSVQNYLFTSNEISTDRLMSELNSAFSHSLNGQPIIPNIELVDTVNINDYKKINVSLHPWTLEKLSPKIVVLGPGEIILNETLVIDNEQKLIIEPGTILSLGEGVSILSNGTAHIEGTASNPIIFKALIKDKPWGVLAIQGADSSGSIIRHANISGGSIDTLNNISYSGMLSLHWSNNFKLEDTIISNNILSDDGLHIVHGDFQLQRLHLNNCFADCIDIDLARGKLIDIKINDAGNDGLDFMTSHININGLEINNAKDKGISAGENSTIHTQNVSINNSNFAIASKDKSTVFLKNGHLVDNHIAISLFSKNWRYGGPGSITINDVQFTNNQVNIQTTENSKVIVQGQGIPDKSIGDGDIINEG